MLMVSDEIRLKMRLRPDKQPLIHQNWRNLLFLHWGCDPELIQKTLPKGLFVDTFEGNAYLGIVPFSIQDQRLGPFPLPGFSSFLEINLRTYVYDEKGKPGVWFYSLDINSSPAAALGRFYYGLPYISSHIKSHITPKGMTDFSVARKENCHLQYSFKPCNTEAASPAGSLNFFLVERYRLFSERNDQLYEASVHHNPYPLNEVDVLQYDEEIFSWNGFTIFDRKPDHALFSAGVDVEIFNPIKLGKNEKIMEKL